MERAGEENRRAFGEARPLAGFDQAPGWDGPPRWRAPPELSPRCEAGRQDEPGRSTTIAVTDLHYETQPDGGQRACLDVSVTSAQTPCSFAMTLPLDHQTGDVEATLHEAQARLLSLFDDVVDELTSGPLERH